MITCEQPNRSIVFCPPCLDSRVFGSAAALAAKSKVEKIIAMELLDIGSSYAKNKIVFRTLKYKEGSVQDYLATPKSRGAAPTMPHTHIPRVSTRIG